jgi:hypothetical protein
MSNKTIDVSHLAQAWVHSHEEDTETTTVYRPAKFPFPPSRGRKGFHLQPDGSLTIRGPGPTDRVVSATGTWKVLDDQLELSSKAEGTQILRIESVQPDRLVVQKTSTR